MRIQESKPHVTFSTLSRSKTTLCLNVHPGNGKSTLLSMLSVGFYSNKNARLCMCIQETENLLYHVYFLYFEYACSNKITHKCASREWKTHITFHILVPLYSKKTTRKCAARNGKPALRYTQF